MAAIKRIDVNIITKNINNAGTDGNVYLGICGREFFLDTSADDFEKGSNRTYVLGNGSNSTNKTENDPGDPQLDSVDLDKFPVYIRFDPLTGGNASWKLSSVNVELAGTGYGVVFQNGIWLGDRSGKFVYLRKGRFGE